MAFLEGQVVLLPQMIGQVGERLDRLEARMFHAFYWLLGVQITTFITTLAAILGVFYMRG